MPNRHYTLTHSLASWQYALSALSEYLPQGVATDDLPALYTLPIFAVVVVIDTATLQKSPKHPDDIITHWADEHNWAVSLVPTQTEHSTLHAPKEASAIGDVEVFRYVFIPKDPKHLSPEKRDTIAHIVDEQLTAHLTHKLNAQTELGLSPDNLPSLSDLDRLDSLDDLNALPALDAKPTYHLDVHIVSVTHMLRRHKLACFDMDSTLIKQEVIVELAKLAGVGDEVDKITEQAMRGEIDFATSFAGRVGLLAGLDESIIDKIKPLLIPQQGAFITISALKSMGYHTALVSGGFEPFAKYIAELLGIDEYHANPLDIDAGKLTGMVTAPILDGNQKAKIVAKIAESRGIDMGDVICVGDGANDLPMMAISDLGIAYHAKPIVQARADASVNVTGLEGVLYALGYPALTVKGGGE